MYNPACLQACHLHRASRLGLWQNPSSPNTQLSQKLSQASTSSPICSWQPHKHLKLNKLTLCECLPSRSKNKQTMGKSKTRISYNSFYKKRQALSHPVNQVKNQGFTLIIFPHKPFPHLILHQTATFIWRFYYTDAVPQAKSVSSLNTDMTSPTQILSLTASVIHLSHTRGCLLWLLSRLSHNPSLPWDCCAAQDDL